MPALPAVPNVIRCQLKHQTPLDFDILPRFYFRYSGTAPTNAQLVTLAGVISGSYNTRMVPLYASGLKMAEVLLEDLTSASGAVGVDNTLRTGTRTGGQLPVQVCTLINFSVARRYRGGKPRIYLPLGVVSDTLSDSTWTAAFIASMNTAWNGLISDIVAAPWSGGTISGQVNVSYYQGFTSVQNPVTLRWRNIATPRATPVVDVVSSVSTNTVFGTQRRRLRP